MSETTITKTLIPNKEWLIKEKDNKIGSVARNKRGYVFYRKGKTIAFSSMSEIITKFGITSLDATHYKKTYNLENSNSVYGYPCDTQPHDPIYSVKEKFPVFTKEPNSKSRFCAGYYIINFKNTWIRSFCPKLITLHRYEYQGPFKTENEMNFAFECVTEINK